MLSPPVTSSSGTSIAKDQSVGYEVVKKIGNSLTATVQSIFAVFMKQVMNAMIILMFLLQLPRLSLTRLLMQLLPGAMAIAKPTWQIVRTLWRGADWCNSPQP